MGQNRGLPTGAGQWSREVDAALRNVEEAGAIVRRLCDDFGLDFSNPSRGISTSEAPTVEKPVQLKLASLKDLDIRDAQDGDVLTFDGTRGKWVARRHEMVQLPKEFPPGDPDSYYVEPVEPDFLPADTWSLLAPRTNLLTDPRFEHGTGNWAWSSDRNNSPTSAAVSIVPGGRGGSGTCMQVFFTNNVTNIPQSHVNISSYGHSLDTKIYRLWVMSPVAMAVEAFLDFVWDGKRETPYTSATLAPGEWTLLSVAGIGGTDPFYGPQLDTALVVGVSGIPSNTSATLYVDDMLISDTTVNYIHGAFNGETPDTDDYLYSWDGEPDNSTSTVTLKRRIQIPSTAPQGSTIQVIGAGFIPGENVQLWVGGDPLDLLTAEPDGTFDARLTIPEDAAITSNNSISALVDVGISPWATINITAAE